MRKVISLTLACAVFFAGCAGREANLVQVRKIGDEQKSCDELRTELYYIENEISRLLPKSDKTGRNIALGATGILFIVPLFFMDLKQGEKKEIEAYRQRYNHLLMITQQKGCKLPTVVTKEASKEKAEGTPDTTNQIKTCANCGEKIGRLEEPRLFKGNVVCTACYNKLMKNKSLETTVEKKPAKLTITLPSGENKE